ncbi:MAG: type II/IV secretion system ATPase subunit [Candidatus Diapherotrites archaeon]|nr:type II/IV secretion system ATPase subunit [Candidatus Diapherotrites archaeon]
MIKARKDERGAVNYEVVPGFASVTIDKEDRTWVYRLSEPIISDDDKKALDKIKDQVIETMEADISLVDKEVQKYLDKKFEEYKQKFKITFTPDKERIIKYYLHRDFIGLGRIEPFMHDPNLEDISCDGVGLPIFVSHKDFGSLRTSIMFETLEELEAFVIKLAQKTGRFISYGEPLLDGSLKDGSRVNATFGAGVTVRGPTFDIRKFREIPFTPCDLISLGTFDALSMAYLWMVIEKRKNLLIAGGTASGKSTVLNAISLFIPENLKIVSIEDTAELNLLHDNWIQSVSRSGLASHGDSGKYGEVSMFDLLKASFRQRPDYVIVGEVRGVEATVMFQGMASGHAGLGTIHAESLDAVVERLSTPPINLPTSLIRILDVLILQISTPEIKENSRRAKEIIEISSSGKEIGSHTVFEWDKETDGYKYLSQSLLLSDTKSQNVKSAKKLKEGEEEMKRRAEFLLAMAESGINFNEFPLWVHMYQDNADKAEKLLKQRMKPS